MTRMHRILCASDFSKASAKAFATAVALAKATRADMTILHVLVPFTPLVPEQYIGGTRWTSSTRMRGDGASSNSPS